jgi:uncharacterized protein YceK
MRSPAIMKTRYVLIFIVICIPLVGCGSLKLHERKAIDSNPADNGSITEVELKGPKAQISHKF